LSGEVKVNIALEMSSTAMALTLDSIRDQHPGIPRSKLFELARRRLRTSYAIKRDVDDIRAILANTRVNMRMILEQARKDDTIGIFREILQLMKTRKSRR